MTVSRLTTIFTVVGSLALATAACNKDDNEARAQSARSGSSRTQKQKPKKNTGPIAMTAAAFHSEYTSLTGPQAMNKYMNRKVLIDGPVLRTMDMGEYGGFQLWLQTGGKNHVAVKFSDDGAAAKSKGLKKGAQVKVQCDIAGMMGKNIHLIGCDLKS